MKRKKALLTTLGISLIIGAGIFFSYQRVVNHERSVPALWKQYYQLIDKREYHSAQHAIHLILKKEPKNNKAIHAQMFLYLGQGKISEAISFMESAHQRLPNDLLISLELAKAYLLVDNTQEAIKLLNDVANSKDEALRKEAKVLLSTRIKDRLLQENKTTSSIEKKAIDATPKMTDQELLDHFKESRLENYEKAKKALMILRARHPDKISYCNDLAQLEKLHGHIDASYKILLQCYHIKPENTFIIEITNYLIEKKEYKAAYEFLEKAKKNPGINVDELNEYHQFINEILKKDQESIILSTPAQNKPALTKQPSEKNTISERDQHLNQYYTLKKKDPKRAQKLLNKLIRKYQHDHELLLEKAYYSLSINNNYTAAYYFVKAYKHKSSAALAEQIGHVYVKLKNPEQADYYFKKALKSNPNKVSLLESLGYNALNMKNQNEAIKYFKRAYDISKKSALALQLGYSNLALNERKEAFSWFEQASRNGSDKIQYQAEESLKNIAGAQFKFLPYPFFLELYTTPFYMNRFDMFVYPVIAKLGATLNKEREAEIYFIYRRTSDSRSGEVPNSLPQIFEDNVAIYGVGFSFKPFKDIGLKAFIEAGAGYDLIDRNRERWRSDIRGGLLYYKDWGKLPAYSKSLKFPWKAYGNFYGDLIYFSRYENLIATLHLRQGFRVLQYKNTSLDAYISVILLQDSKREFFNNYIDIGPGLVLTPHNHYPIKLRVVWLHGYYFPIDSITPNPYPSTYSNLVAYVEANFRF